jgi:hypothetical protein
VQTYIIIKSLQQLCKTPLYVYGKILKKNWQVLSTLQMQVK